MEITSGARKDVEAHEPKRKRKKVKNCEDDSIYMTTATEDDIYETSQSFQLYTFTEYSGNTMSNAQALHDSVETQAAIVGGSQPSSVGTGCLFFGYSTKPRLRRESSSIQFNSAREPTSYPRISCLTHLHTKPARSTK